MIISHNYREKGKNKLYNTQDKTELEQLIHLIDFKTTPLRYRLLQESANCRCGGDMTFEFYKGRDLIGRFTFHHWMTIRERKDKDLTNESQKRIRNWLKTKGITKEILSSNGVKGSVENWLKQKKMPEEMLDPERLEELLKQEGFTE